MRILDKIKSFFDVFWEKIDVLINEGIDSIDRHIDMTKETLGDPILEVWEDIKELVSEKARNELRIVLEKLDKLNLVNKTAELNYAELFVYNKEARKHFKNLVAIKRLLF